MDHDITWDPHKMQCYLAKKNKKMTKVMGIFDGPRKYNSNQGHPNAEKKTLHGLLHV